MLDKYNVIDLFSGCGGLSEGFMQTDKFHFLGHVEWEFPMVKTLRDNLVHRWNYSEEEAIKKVIHFDIQKTDELLYGNWSAETMKIFGPTNDINITKHGMEYNIGSQKVDIIIGGPPCQAYSIAGRAQDPNSMQDDYRNYLFESFVKVVAAYRPKMFIFENVPGILSAKPGGIPVLERIEESFNAIGYEIRHPFEMKNSVYSSVDFEVPQDRKRVIIVGVAKETNLDLEHYYEILDTLKVDERKTVRDAIFDFPKLIPLEEPVRIGNKNISHAFIEENEIDLHLPRYHNIRDISIFKEWLQNDMNTYPVQDKLEFYYNKTGKQSKHNKYRSLYWDKPSPTIVSHLYKDGLMFIHPDIEQQRSLTIREAATLQSFPPDYIFSGSSAYCFKMIGNAVPVLFSKKIGEAAVIFLEGELNETT